MTGLWRRCSEAGKSMSFEIRPKLKPWPSLFLPSRADTRNLVSPHFSSILVSAHSPICQSLFVTPKNQHSQHFQIHSQVCMGRGDFEQPMCMLPAEGSKAMFYFCSIFHTISKCAFVTYVITCFLHLCFSLGGAFKMVPKLSAEVLPCVPKARSL